MRFGLTALALLATYPNVQAQTIQVLLQAGDVIPGVGTVDAGQFGDPMLFLQVNDSGEWMIQFEYDDSDQDAVMRNGTVVLKSGDPEPSGTIPGATLIPGAASISPFSSWRLYNSGVVTWNLNLDGTPLGVDDNNAVYIDNTLVLQENGVPPSPGWGAGTTFAAFDEPYLTDVGSLIVRGRNDDPISTTTTDWFISVFPLDGSNQVIGETIIARTGDFLPGVTVGAFRVNTIRSGFLNGTANGAGDAVFGASLSGAPSGMDSVVYRWDANTQALTKIAEEGELDPITGQPFGSIVSPEFHLTESGILTWKDQVASPTSDFIVSNGALFRFEGDTHPAFPGETLTGFSNGYAKRLDDGRVFWVGDFTGATSADAGLFIDDEILVQESVTMANGMLIDELSAQTEDQFISDNGRWLIFKGELANVDTVFLMELPVEFIESCNGDGGDGMGCTPCPCGNDAVAGTVGGCVNSSGFGARLTGSGSASVTAPDPTDLRFDMEGGVGNSFAVLTSGDAIAPQNPMNPCFGLPSGVTSAVLDGLRCAVTNTQRHGGRPVAADGTVGSSTNGWGGADGPAVGLAAQGGFVAGQTRHYQTFYRELPGMVCGTEQNTTQAVSVTFEP